MATKIYHVFGNKMSVSIPLQKVLRTLVSGEVVETSQDFYPNPEYPTVVRLYKNSMISHSYATVVSENVVSFEDDGTLRVGEYNVEVTCRDDDAEPCRFMAKGVVVVVDATADAHIEEGVEFDATTYTLDGAIFPSVGTGRVIWEIGRIDSPNFTEHNWGDLQKMATNDGIAFILRSDTSGNECYHYMTSRIQQGGNLLLQVSFTAINGRTITNYTLTNASGLIRCDISNISL